MSLLKRHGFLTTKRVSFSGGSYYLATDLAQRALANKFLDRNFARPNPEIDVRSFEHDLRVIKARLALENLGRASKWISERRLKSESAQSSGLERAYQPDAIYWNKRGEIMAFELELAAKTKIRYPEYFMRFKKRAGLFAIKPQISSS